jgi:hypothetical protein
MKSKHEIELLGIGNGWTDVSVDVMGEDDLDYGLPGYSPRDRVAKTGEHQFNLDNSARNSVGLEGAYSPDHVNCRAGFAEGIRVRYSQLFGDMLSYKQRVMSHAPIGYWRLGETEGYAQAVLSDVPSAYWRLGESSGNALDSSGNANVGTVNGTVTRQVAGALSDGDKAMTFDGSTGWIQGAGAGTFNFLGTAAFAIETFVNIPALPSAGTFPRLVAKVANDGLGKTGWHLFIEPTADPNVGKIGFERWLNGAVSLALSGTALTIGAWNHVFALYDGTNMTVYLNGVAGTPVASSLALVASSSVVALARRGDSAASFLTGSLDETAIYSYAVSSQQLSNHYALRTSTVATVAAMTSADDSGHSHTMIANKGVTFAQAGRAQ